MADSPLTVPRDSQGNIPKWVLVGGGIVAVVALYSFAKNKQTGVGGSTVAAGTSINAALGSLQEEQLNTTGLVSKGNADNALAMSAISDQVHGVADQNLNTQAQLDINQGHLLATSNALSDQIHGVAAQNVNSQSQLDMVNGQAQMANLSLQNLTDQHLITAASGTF